TEFVHDLAEMAEGLHSTLEDLLAETVPQENAFAQAERIALVVERLNIESGIGPSDAETHGVGACVDRGDVNGICHSPVNARGALALLRARISWSECRVARQSAAAIACSPWQR